MENILTVEQMSIKYNKNVSKMLNRTKVLTFIKPSWDTLYILTNIYNNYFK